METVVQEPRMGSPNPMYPTTLVTVLLCSILTTIFTAARLITKRLMSKYNIEDCESNNSVVVADQLLTSDHHRFSDRSMGNQGRLV